jgi:hypothetical protein
MRTRKTKGRKGSTASGGGRSRIHRETVSDRRARYDAPPALLALLRATWTKRNLLAPKAREMIASFLRQAQAGPLTDKQIDAAAAIGQSVAVGFDDPRLDEPAVDAGSKVQPWGPLPLRPPTRAVS